MNKIDEYNMQGRTKAKFLGREGGVKMKILLTKICDFTNFLLARGIQAFGSIRK